MESLLLTQIVGVVLSVFGLGMLFNLEYYSKNLSTFWKNPALEFTTGLTMLILGLIVVLNHNIWEKSWTVVITLVGWITLIKSIALIIFPKSISFIGGLFEKNLKGYLLFDAILLLILGGYLCYQGFFVV